MVSCDVRNRSKNNLLWNAVRIVWVQVKRYLFLRHQNNLSLHRRPNSMKQRVQRGCTPGEVAGLATSHVNLSILPGFRLCACAWTTVGRKNQRPMSKLPTALVALVIRSGEYLFERTELKAFLNGKYVFSWLTSVKVWLHYTVSWSDFLRFSLRHVVYPIIWPI